MLAPLTFSYYLFRIKNFRSRIYLEIVEKGFVLDGDTGDKRKKLPETLKINFVPWIYILGFGYLNEIRKSEIDRSARVLRER